MPDDSTPPFGAAPDQPGETRDGGPSSGRLGEVVDGRFTLIELLGRGAMGSVWLARDAKLEREVALKIYLDDVPLVPETRLRQFRREARLLAQLEDPRIVAVHDLGRDGDRWYIAMAHVRGCTLQRAVEHVAAQIEAGALPPLRRGLPGHALGRLLDGSSPPDRLSLLGEDYDLTVAAIAEQAAGALQVAHARGVLHRDLKPSNLMLTAGGWPVIVDFGLGGEIGKDPGTLTRGLWGTPAYLAPEQARGARTGADARSDVYQLGLVLYELLTLRPALPPAANVEQAVAAAARGVIRSPRELDRRVPRELDAVSRRALAPDPMARYPTAEGLRADLARFCERRRPSGSTLSRLGAWLRRRGRGAGMAT